MTALKADGFPRQPHADMSPKLRGSGHRTLVFEAGGKTVRLSLNPERVMCQDGAPDL